MPTIQPGGPPNVFKLADVLPAIRSFVASYSRAVPLDENWLLAIDEQAR